MIQMSRSSGTKPSTHRSGRPNGPLERVLSATRPVTGERRPNWLGERSGRPPTTPGKSRSAELSMRAARAALVGSDWQVALEDAGRALRHFTELGLDREAARAQLVVDRGLQLAGRSAEAQVQLQQALQVMRVEPGEDTADALETIAGVALFGGYPGGEELAIEALALGEEVGVDAAHMSELLEMRAIAHSLADRSTEAISFHRRAVAKAEESGDGSSLCYALNNLAADLCSSDPVSCAQTARDAATVARRIGSRYQLGFAIMNLAVALLETGEWDEAESTIRAAIDEEGMDDNEYLSAYSAQLAALRGDVETATRVLKSLPTLRHSETRLEQAFVALIEALLADAHGNRTQTLRLGRVVLAEVPVVGVRTEVVRWAWPLTARAAIDLADDDAHAELVELLADRSADQLPPLLQAELTLALAHELAARTPDRPDSPFWPALTELRAVGSPFHLAHALLDHASYLARHGSVDESAVAEALTIAERLRCRPLLDRIVLLSAPTGSAAVAQ